MNRKSLIVPEILNKNFRTSELYLLVEWTEVPEIIKKNLINVYDELEVYGVFLPISSSSYQAKLAYKEVSLLYFHLKTQTFLPRYIRLLNQDSIRDTLVQLVLDEILEIEHLGTFYRGSAAIPCLFEDPMALVHGDESPPNHILYQLSLEAIKYAWSLPIRDFKSLSRKLYTYNTFLPDPLENNKSIQNFNIVNFLFHHNPGWDAHGLKENWTMRNRENSSWIYFHRVTQPSQNFNASNSPTFKLYISPDWKDLPKILEWIFPLIDQSKAISFKLGQGVNGLNRPDKFIIYFNNREDALKTGYEIENRLIDLPVQGVPFTCPIGNTGILSWGMDPPGNEVLKELEGGSWRARVIDIIAQALSLSKTGGYSWNESINYIYAQLYSHQIDPKQWIPIME